ncbi:TPA: [citrate (pro-3S)-lyase] ligase [Enterobacter cloacae]|nr:[citrate (pro-3S)-lyase] ligase [Enterobacter cloacae]HDC4601137.1 [citrate (pro-3S)-lyase] ligase [Enterobacter cloacae]
MFTVRTPEFEVINASNAQAREEVAAFLARNGLGIDDDIAQFIVARYQRHLVACTGIAGNTLKCIAVDAGWRGTSLILTLIHEAELQAAQNGEHQLFLFTCPDNVKSFRGCGFYPLVTVGKRAALMENTPVGIHRYCSELRHHHLVPGNTIGAIVMNANPFTLGHQYLIEHAASRCDHLHVFVVQEDLSAFSFKERFAMVRDGSRHIPNVTVHPGSAYIISRGTFPGYFLKDKQVIDKVYAAIDLLLFRNYIAPALSIHHRFVGTEPFCPLTAEYNRAMHRWLEDETSAAPRICVHEIERKTDGFNVPVSASAVRRLLKENNIAAASRMVPATTRAFLNNGVQHQPCLSEPLTAPV